MFKGQKSRQKTSGFPKTEKKKEDIWSKKMMSQNKKLLSIIFESHVRPLFLFLSSSPTHIRVTRRKQKSDSSTVPARSTTPHTHSRANCHRALVGKGASGREREREREREPVKSWELSRARATEWRDIE